MVLRDKIFSKIVNFIIYTTYSMPLFANSSGVDGTYYQILFGEKALYEFDSGIFHTSSKNYGTYKGTYKVDNKTVHLFNENGKETVTLTIQDDSTLIGPFGIKIMKEQ